MNNHEAPTQSIFSNNAPVSETIKTFADCIAEIIIILTPDYTVQFINSSVSTLLGYELSAILNRPFCQFVHPDDCIAIRQGLDQLTIGKCWSQPLRIRLRHDDGSWRIFELHACSHQQQEQIVGIVLSGYDITALLAADHALRNNEYRYRQLLELMPMLIVISSFADGLIRYCNPAGARIFGVSDPTALLNCPLTEFLSAEEHALMWHRRQRLRNGETIEPVRYHIYARDQVVRVVELQGVFIEGSGEPQVLSFGFDVSDRLEAERQLNLRAKVLAQINEAVIVTDRSGAIIYLNETAAYLYGVRPEEVIDQPLSRLFIAEPLPYQLPDPADRNTTPHRGWRGELLHRLPNGRTMIVDVSIDPLCHDELATGGTLIVVRDITHRKQVEERLRLLESVVVNTNDAVLILDAEPLQAPGPFIRYANAACTRLTGYATQELIGRSLRILHGPATDPTTLAMLWQAMERQQTIRLELLYYSRAGEPIWVDMSLSPVT